MIIVNNTQKVRTLRINAADVTTADALALWRELYAEQRAEDLASRKARAAQLAKRREGLPIHSGIDQFLRVPLRPGANEIPDGFAPFAMRAIAGEAAYGTMSVSNVPPEAMPDTTVVFEIPDDGPDADEN